MGGQPPFSIMNQMNEQVEVFESWAIIELFGHYKLGGKVQETVVCGTKFLQIYCFDINGNQVATTIYSPTAIYSITPVTEEIAIRFGVKNPMTPASVWCLQLADLKTDYDDEYGD